MDEHGHLVSRDYETVLRDGEFELESKVTETICLGLGDEKRLGKNCTIYQRPSGLCDKPGQAGATCVGPVYRVARVARTCLCNAHNAICNRHGVKAPQATLKFTNAEKLIEASLHQVEHVYWMYMHHYEREWINKWPEGKRRAILNSQIVDVIEPGKVKCMVKREVAHKDLKKARAIQFYPNLATQAVFGPEYTSLQKAYCQIYNRLQYKQGKVGVTIASGMNGKDLSDWMTQALQRLKDPHVYERDGASWDATMQGIHHDLARKAYSFMPKAFLDFFEKAWDVKGSCSSRGGCFRYRLKGTTKSGHNDTTTFNSIINLCIAYEACVRMELEAEILVAGDDLIVIIAGDFDEHEFARIESGFGINPEYRKFDNVSEASFISGLWVPHTNHFLPKPGRIFARLWWAVKPPSRKNFDAYRRGVVKGLLPACAGVPCLGAFLEKFDGHGAIYTACRSTYRDWFYSKSAESTATRDWFKTRYNVNESDIAEFEATLTTQPKLCKHWLVERMIEVDCCDLEDREKAAFC